MPPLSEASRPIMWNITGAWVMYVLFIVALGIFSWGLFLRIRAWREGKGADERLADWWVRCKLLIRELLFQQRVRGSRLPGFFHSLIFYSFAVLVITTAIVALDYDFGTNFFTGYLYVALTVGSELGGVLILVGVSIALWRRLVVKPTWLETRPGDIWALLFVALLVLSGFLVEGLRLATHPDPWAWLSPVGLAFASVLGGLSEETGRAAHQGSWWFHTAAAMGWIAAIPYTKFAHLVTLPTNVFFSRMKPYGELARVDIEEVMSKDDFDEESFNIGIQKSEDFTWKNRLDFEACINCGRCEQLCPATAAGHAFSPRRLVNACKESVEEWRRTAATAAAEGKEAPPIEIIGKALDQKFIWYCRTCMACMEVCPAAIEHVDLLMELRRNEVMMQGRVPTEAGRAIKSLENLGNPFGPQSDRVDWVSDLKVKVVPAGGSCDVLLWIGCCTTYDETKRAIAVDLCSLMEQCGMDYGVLGADERCCGDPARVLGEERLFQEIAKRQIEALNKRSFKVLITACPHCYNVLKNEYPQFGGKFTVAHHSEFLHEMMWSGDLRPMEGRRRRIVYHDPCYLGRYQRLYDSPRQVLKAIPGAKVVEMPDNQSRSLCCGGGGGHFFMDFKATTRINNLRLEQAVQAKADTIVTACAYCRQMLEDAVKQKDLDGQVEVIDLVSLTRSAVPRPGAGDESQS